MKDVNDKPSNQNIKANLKRKRAEQKKKRKIKKRNLHTHSLTHILSFFMSFILSLSCFTKQSQITISSLSSSMSMAALSNLLCLSFIFFFFCMNMVIMAAKTSVQVEATSWCVARSDASNQALQTALDYACGAGADCQPIHSDGLCYLPNTMQAHASYAFDSYFQRKGMAPGSCDFSGTATIAKTDPSLFS